jgi:hypothetical protein
MNQAHRGQLDPSDFASQEVLRNILYLRPSNAKDFDRGCRNPKDFVFKGLCADSHIFDLVCVRRLEP